jgi:tRNA(Ile)-lysidine synthase
MKKTEQKVLRFIDEKDLIEKDDRILVALSGGPDSVFLLQFLNKYSKKFKITLAAIHINHGLRGKAASSDETFCKELTKKLGVRFYSIKRNVKALAKKLKVSTEEAGRLIRYEEFEKLSVKEGFTKITTAHIADDNAETVLLNLIKGTGLNGISGIPYARGKIIRPLLVLTKSEIVQYLKFYKINYKTDLTNLQSDYERNFLRNEIIPLIKKRLNPSLENTLLKSSEVFKEINNFVKKKLKDEINNLIIKKDDTLSISLSSLNNIESELRGEAVRLVFEKEYKIQLSFDEVKKIFTLIEKQPGRSINLQGKLKVVRERNEFVVINQKKEVTLEPLVISSGDSVKVNDKLISIKEVTTKEKQFDSDKNIEFINGDKTKSKFVLRRWQPGDRFIPLGMKGSKKVSDFLSEQKISTYNKKDQMILTNDDRIVWVIGLRLDNRFRITQQTKKIYELCIT